ncbi:MAG: carbohydrate kinase family protein [Ardenticatenaceae bacterium]|nr:carbohydrate kinase family protein [Ardenticatenaceae bacterium]HBY93139.1 hypothetical protein [Chloroflexota bacterium]
MEVIGVGDADVDIYLDVDHIPGRDEKLLARRVDLCPGGMVANFLVALCRLGTTCGFHGPVGDDEFGRRVLDSLAANGVDISGAVVKPGGQTYFCTVMLDESGEKSLVVAPTDCLFPQPEDVDAEVIAQACHLHTTAAVIPTASKAVRIAKQHGLTVSLDLEASNARHPDMPALLADVDVLFVNQGALRLLNNSGSPQEVAERLLEYGPSVVCVTMGAAGALVASADGSLQVAVFPVTVVDSTGAGDCFAAGCVHGFLKGWPLSATATFASAVGAISVTQRGGHTGTPTADEVRAFLASRGYDLAQWLQS